jgi:hypothetical protein
MKVRVEIDFDNKVVDASVAEIELAHMLRALSTAIKDGFLSTGTHQLLCPTGVTGFVKVTDAMV